MSTSLEKELARFFMSAWDSYNDAPSEDLEWLLAKTGLVDEHVVTEEDVMLERAPEGHTEGDTCYVLSTLGQQAWDIAKSKT